MAEKRALGGSKGNATREPHVAREAHVARQQVCRHRSWRVSIRQTPHGKVIHELPRLIIAASAAVSLSLGLGGLSGGVLAQTNSGVVVIDDASGTNGTNGTCTNAGPRRTRNPCGDLRPDPGITGTDPSPETAPVAPEVVPTPVEIVPPAAAEPVAETTVRRDERTRGHR